MHPTEKEPNRQAVLLAGAAAGTMAALGAVGVLGASPASAATRSVTPSGGGRSGAAWSRARCGRWEL
jgi:hypothetical protein